MSIFWLFNDFASARTFSTFKNRKRKENPVYSFDVVVNSCCSIYGCFL